MTDEINIDVWKKITQQCYIKFDVIYIRLVYTVRFHASKNETVCDKGFKE